jgi:hypothetical protein
MDELNSPEFMNSGIPLENFPLVPRGHHHHHRDHLAFTCFISILTKNVKNKNCRELYVLHFL